MLYKIFPKLNNRKEQAVVLLYHRVINLKDDPQLLCVSPENFKAHLLHLKKTYNLVSVESLVTDLDQKRLKNRSVAITFDDGYFDNYDNALPILEELQIPATMFVSDCNIDTGFEFFWDELERILLREHKQSFNIDLAACGIDYKADLKDKENIRDVYFKVCSIVKPLNADARKSVISYLQEKAGITSEGRNTHRSLSSDELRKLSDSRFIEIGGHTRNHVRLSQLSKEEQYSEIKSNIEFLEKQTGGRIRTFSYPFGTKSDFNSTSIKIVRSLGLESAFVNTSMNVTPHSKPFNISRRLVRNWTLEIFKKNLEKYFKNERVDIM